MNKRERAWMVATAALSAAVVILACVHVALTLNALR